MRYVLCALLLVSCTPDVEFHLCPEDDCYDLLLSHIENASTVNCALYSAPVEVKEKVERKGSLVTENNRASLMHNKFCVFDENTVWTGSYNPTSKSSNDSIVIIHDARVADVFLSEHRELKRNVQVSAPYESRYIDVYFCPEDDCLSAVVKEIRAAENSIFFAWYSFTHPRIANELRLAEQKGVLLSGIVEKNRISQYPTLSHVSAVAQHNSSSTFHHKLLVIDNETLVIGSMNPTRNGAYYNDENLVVIHGRVAQEARARMT